MVMVGVGIRVWVDVRIMVRFNIINMHPLAAASRSRLLQTEPRLFVFATSYYSCMRLRE